MTDYFSEPLSGQKAINISSSGDNTVLSMFSYLTGRFPTANIKDLTNRRIFVTSYLINCHDAVSVTWKSGSTALSGPISMPINGIIAAQSANDPAIIWTEKNNDLVLNLSTAVQVSGHLSFYIQ